MNAYIKAITYVLPEIKITNEQLVQEFPEWSVDKIANKVGINTRYIAAPDETATDLAVKAANKMFEEYPHIVKSKIDFVLFCTQSPDYFLPTSACIIQDRLGLSTSCGALDFNLGCSGYVYGLSLAKGLIAGGVAKKVLLLTGETYSKHLHFKDKGNRTIFGDAASATLVATDGFATIGNFSLGTDGKGAENLIVKTGAFRQRKSVGDITFDNKANPISSDDLYMNGTEIFNFTIEAIPSLVKDTLTKNDLIKEDIDGYVFHQANAFMLNFLRKKLKIEEKHFFYYMEEVGNTVSSTIPIVLYEKMKTNELRGNVLLAGFGVGYSWGGCIIKIK